MGTALHAFEDKRAGMLQGHVDVLHERFVGGDGIEQLLRDLIWIGVEETDPFGEFGGDLGETREELSQAVFETEVFAVTSGVLTDQIDFANAHGEHAGGFVDDALEATAAEVPAKLRNDAEGAGVIAALGNLYVGRVAGSGEDAFGEIVIEVGTGGELLGLEAFAKGSDSFEFVGAEDGVDIGNVLLDIGPEAFDETAGDHEALGFAGSFVFGHFQNGVDGFLLGGVDEAAGVNNDDVGIGRLGSKLVAVCHELAHHDLGINEIFWAAETYKSDFQGVRSPG